MIVIALFTFNFQAEAQNCNQGKKLAEKTWEKFGPWKPNFTIVPLLTIAAPQLAPDSLKLMVAMKPEPLLVKHRVLL